MYLMKSRHSKSLIAMVLAIFLIASMLPMFTYRASASTYFSVTGTIIDATMNTITVLCRGRYRTFGKSDAKLINVTDGIALKDTVKIVYNGNNSKEAVQIIMITHSSSQNRIPHDPGTSHSLTGTVRDIAMSTITISYNGTKYVFSQEDADILNASGGINTGDRVTIVYYPDDPSVALQVVKLSSASGSGYDISDYNRGPINRTFSGWVCDMGDNYVSVQDLETGKTLTFWYDESDDDNFPDMAISDVVRVLYSDDQPGIANRIIMIDQSYNH